jgi:hypothetical protein
MTNNSNGTNILHDNRPHEHTRSYRRSSRRRTHQPSAEGMVQWKGPTSWVKITLVTWTVIGVVGFTAANYCKSRDAKRPLQQVQAVRPVETARPANSELESQWATK